MTPPNSLCTNASRHGKWFNAVPRDSSVTFLSYDALLFQSNASSTRQSTPPLHDPCAPLSSSFMCSRTLLVLTHRAFSHEQARWARARAQVSTRSSAPRAGGGRPLLAYSVHGSRPPSPEPFVVAATILGNYRTLPGAGRAAVYTRIQHASLFTYIFENKEEPSLISAIIWMYCLIQRDGTLDGHLGLIQSCRISTNANTNVLHHRAAHFLFSAVSRSFERGLRSGPNTAITQARTVLNALRRNPAFFLRQSRHVSYLPSLGIERPHLMQCLCPSALLSITSFRRNLNLNIKTTFD